MEQSQLDSELYQKILEKINNDIKEIHEKTYKDSQEIIKKTLDYGNEINKSLVGNTEKKIKELIELTKQNQRVLEIKINETEIKKLSNEAVPYLDRMIVNAKLGLNTLLVGPAGCGKTFAAKQLSEALDLKFGHLNLTAGASETWLFGRQTPNGFIEGIFSKLYKEGGVFLADEIDAADANLLLSINTAIANGHLYNPISGEMIERNKDFVFIGAANTFGKGGDHNYTGRNRLDAATLDRFVMIEVTYNKKVEEFLCPNESLRETLWKMREKLTSIGAQEIISTRLMQIAQLQLSAGVKFQKIFESITLSWPEDIRDQVSEFKNMVKEDQGTVEVKRGRGRPKKEQTTQQDDIPF